MRTDQAIKVLNLGAGFNLKHLKTRYRKLAHLHHPDKGGNVETMQLINDAYSTLLNNEEVITHYAQASTEEEKTTTNTDIFTVFVHSFYDCYFTFLNQSFRAF